MSHVACAAEIDLFLHVKVGNRKKHNSQEWFLQCFCRDLQPPPDHVFLVDVGTGFDRLCVHNLKKCLVERGGDIIACTGTARVMTVQKQLPEFQHRACCMKEEDGSDCCLRSCLRHVQRYEMEASHLMDKPLWSAIGFLPVLPGPCMYFRFVHDNTAGLQNQFDAALVWFFEFMDRPVGKLGYIRANLTLAEDRLLTWAMVIGTGKTNCWVSGAIFTFDAVVRV